MRKAAEYGIRPVCASDMDGVLALSMRAGAGLTSLQPDARFIEALIGKSEASFAQPAHSESQVFLLIMESFETGDLVGCASVKTRVSTDDFLCADFEWHGDRPGGPANLVLKRTLAGYTEVGSLFLRADHRASGAGRFLARARYMLMGARKHLFDRPIVAQLRGWSDAEGRAPFYENVWRNRLSIPYQQCDARLARDGAKFILDAYEGLEIDIRTLSVEAAAAIGRTHPTASGALSLLEQEGFRCANLVDLADGGPLLIATIGALPCWQTARPVALAVSKPAPTASLAMLTNASFDGFRACVGAFTERHGSVACPGYVADFLAPGRHPVLLTAGTRSGVPNCRAQSH
ncbi:arginine N-succinyltransferase [Hyphomonas sp. NPDC076900]|uniref:arginine N-succinyltransferase n=1 Tax=unclassified Hyphomonas TaxID=2630699 RepID=UPI003D0070E6